MESKTCVACGMPMTRDEDFAKGDRSKDYCLHCARPDGSMRSYEETKVGMTAFMMKSQGLDEAAAQAAVQQMMARLPAWAGRS